MATKVAAAALQYSKWLSRFICWIWAIYRLLFLIFASLQPAAAEAMASTLSGIDTIMLANEFTYLCNSIGEKWIYSDKFLLKWLDKKGFTSFVGKIASKITNTDNDTNEEEQETEEEGEENG